MKLQYPIAIPPARVGQPFAANPPDYARFGLAGHDGQDFPTPIGTPVLAAHDGYVSAANSSNSAYGLYLAVAWEEDGVIYENVYGHFSELHYPDFPDNVFNKQYPVKAGDVIGLSGNTGNSTGPHLHFGLRIYNLQGQLLNHDNGFLGCVDPMPYLEEKETMTNSFFVYDTVKNEFSIAAPKTNPDALISDALNAGLALPMKPGLPDTAPAADRIDFDALKASARLLQ
jgi:murein DD-endopeptidase MepM/ murein hydrolase activator NlpD